MVVVILRFFSFTNCGTKMKSHVWPRRIKAWWTNMAESDGRIFVISDIWTFFIVNILFYHGYCKDERNAAVIIQRYAMLRHNALIMRSDTHIFFWHNVKKSVHLKFKIMPIICIYQRFRCGVDLVYFACKKSNSGEALLFQVNLPLLKHIVD